METKKRILILELTDEDFETLELEAENVNLTSSELLKRFIKDLLYSDSIADWLKRSFDDVQW